MLMGTSITVRPAAKLDLLEQLVGHVIHLLFGGDDVEHVEDKGKQDGNDQDIYKNADIGCVAIFRQQELPQFFLQCFTSRQ